jgi:hypothetical protein
MRTPRMVTLTICLAVRSVAVLLIMRPLLAVVAAASVVVALAVPAAASPDSVTEGDVRAHFQAGEGAGALLFSIPTPAATLAAPANLFEHGIRPFPGSPWEGAHFCEDDWQLLVIAELEPSRADLVPVTVELRLDGVLLETETTAPKRQKEGLFNDGGVLIPISGWWFQQTGAFFAPGELAVGSHEYGATFVVPGVGVFPIPRITIHIDAAGQGACL